MEPVTPHATALTFHSLVLHVRFPHRHSELMELDTPLGRLPTDDHAMWGRVPTIHDQLHRLPGLPQEMLGMPQAIPHQNDDLPWPIVQAAEAGDEAAMSAYLKDGGHANARTTIETGGITLLMLAARAGQTRMVVLLLARGGEPNLKHAHGGTALMSAAEQGHLAVAKQLLRVRHRQQLWRLLALL